MDLDYNYCEGAVGHNSCDICKRYINNYKLNDSVNYLIPDLIDGDYDDDYCPEFEYK